VARASGCSVSVHPESAGEGVCALLTSNQLGPLFEGGRDLTPISTHLELSDPLVQHGQLFLVRDELRHRLVTAGRDRVVASARCELPTLLGPASASGEHPPRERHADDREDAEKEKEEEHVGAMLLFWM